MPTIGTRANAFGATVVDLGTAGYVESEHRVSGDAVGADDVGDAPHTAAFTTRLLVRRPVDPAQFSGRVLVEWLNVSQGFDFSIGWPTGEPFALREGWAWVGVTAQPVGTAFLRGWDLVRYGDLEHPWRPDGEIPQFVIGETWSDGVFAAVGTALREHGDAVFGRVPDRLYGYGQSQSCGRIAGYVASVVNANPDANAYDGFLMHAGGAEPAATMLGDEPSMAVVSAPVPVIHVNSEWEALAGADVPSDNERYRFWEVPGSGHGPRRASDWARKQRDRDLGAQRGPVGMASPSISTHSRWYRSSMPCAPRWRTSTRGRAGALPHRRRRASSSSANSSRRPSRSESSPSHASGSSSHATLTATRSGACGSPTSRRPTGGTSRATSRAIQPDRGLHSLQRHRDDRPHPAPGTYAQRVELACNDAVKAGFLLALDAEQIIQDAASTGR